MIRLLSLDTATDRGSFCLWAGTVTDAGVTCETSSVFLCPTGQPHAETLLPALRDALNSHGWQLDSIDAIVFDSGPGMFTGLRVSAALAQGLAVALNKPVIPVSSLEVLAESAYQASGATAILSLLDARMQQIYAGGWLRQATGWQPVFEACLVNPEALDTLPAMAIGTQAAGTAIDEYPPVKTWLAARHMPDSAIRYPTADALARLGALRFNAGLLIDPAQALPIYVRDRVALTTDERAAGATL